MRLYHCRGKKEAARKVYEFHVVAVHPAVEGVRVPLLQLVHDPAANHRFFHDFFVAGAVGGFKHLAQADGGAAFNHLAGHAFGGGGLGGHPVFSLGVLSSFARWTCFSRVSGNMFTARVGKAHRGALRGRGNHP